MAHGVTERVAGESRHCLDVANWRPRHLHLPHLLSMSQLIYVCETRRRAQHLFRPGKQLPFDHEVRRQAHPVRGGIFSCARQQQRRELPVAGAHVLSGGCGLVPAERAFRTEMRLKKRAGAGRLLRGPHGALHGQALWRAEAADGAAVARGRQQRSHGAGCSRTQRDGGAECVAVQPSSSICQRGVL